jgi:acyl-CoA thioester hydrolase
VIKESVFVQIPFHDIDILRIVWHGHYLKYFEVARTALMKRLGLDWPVLEAHGVAMPVIRSHAEYRKALTYDQTVRVTATVEEWKYPEFVVRYEVRDPKTDELHANGETQQIYFDIETRQTSFEVPAFIAEAFAKG